MARVSGLIVSTTVNTYQTQLKGIQQDYKHHIELLQYLANTWLDPWATQIIRAYAD